MNILTKNSIQLRAPEPSDIDILYKWENDTDVWQLSNTLSPFSKDTIKDFVENVNADIYQAKQQRFMIDNIDNSKIITIGTIDLFDFDPFNNRAGIGILINKKNRNKGYASEALKILINYSFTILQLHQLYCNINTNNKTSINLFVSQGFTLSGKKKEWNKTLSGWEDELFFQLINNNSDIKINPK
ncbi:MAG: GNAT family protein [Bacteroidales bacterium]|nr:GNAT family protein [Bacteroidales bacterium]